MKSKQFISEAGHQEVWAKELAAKNREKKAAERAAKVPYKAPSYANPKPKKLTAEQIFYRAEWAISQSFPDGDPADYLVPWLEKHNLYMDDVHRAFRKLGKGKDFYSYLAGMWEDFQGDQIHDAEHGHADDNSVFYNVEADGSITPKANPWGSSNRKAKKSKASVQTEATGPNGGSFNVGDEVRINSHGHPDHMSSGKVVAVNKDNGNGVDHLMVKVKLDRMQGTGGPTKTYWARDLELEHSAPVHEGSDTGTKSTGIYVIDISKGKNNRKIAFGPYASTVTAYDKINSLTSSGVHTNQNYVASIKTPNGWQSLSWDHEPIGGLFQISEAAPAKRLRPTTQEEFSYTPKPSVKTPDLFGLVVAGLTPEAAAVIKSFKYRSYGGKPSFLDRAQSVSGIKMAQNFNASKVWLIFKKGIDEATAMATIKQWMAKELATKKTEIAQNVVHKAGLPARKKEAAKLSAQDRKQKLEALYAKYGKETVQRVTARQIGGDDGYQWNVLIDGRPMVNGLTRSEVDYYKRMAYDQINGKR